MRRSNPALVLLTVCAACLLMPFAMAGVSVTLPGIATDLHSGLASEQWIVNGYDLTFGSLMLALGSLADLFGRRRLFTIGVAVFAASALAGALSTDIAMLDVARALAGAGAAATLTSGSAILADTFEGAARAKAFGVFGTVVGLGLAFGAPLAGTLVNAFGWRSVFVAPAIVGAVILVLTRTLTESRNPNARRVDWLGTGTFTGALGLFILALVEGPQLGWGHPVVLAGFVGFVVLLAGFVVVEQRSAEPMFDLSLLTQRRFVGLCLAVMAFVGVFTPVAMQLPSYLMAVNDISAQRAGVLLLMLGVPTLIFPAVAGATTRWIPARHQLVVAIALSGVGAAWLTDIHPHAAALILLGPLVLIGTGIGIAFGLLDNLAVSSVEPQRAGMAAGMFNTTRIGGETIAIAVVGSLLVSFTSSRLTGHAGSPKTVANLLNQGDMAKAATGMTGRAHEAVAAAAYTGALHSVLWILAAMCAVVVPVVAVLLREHRAPVVTTSDEPAVPDPVAV